MNQRLGLVAILLATACARRTPPMVTSADAARSGVELAQLQEGRSLLLAKCANCHKTPMPSEHAAGEWPRMLDEMAARSNLDAVQRMKLEKYLVTMAEAPPPTATR